MTARRAEVARLYCQGWPQHKIAQRYRLTRQSITHDLACIRREWRRVMVKEFDRLKAEQLAKVDEAERQAWRGWRRSLHDAEKVTTATGVKPPPADGQPAPPPGRAEETKVTEGQAGDPRFLQIVLACVERRCKLLGFGESAAPARLAPPITIIEVGLAPPRPEPRTVEALPPGPESLEVPNGVQSPHD